jgi:hypothetical protein
MSFERIVLLIMLGVIIIGGFYADHKISKLENELSQQVIDTVTVEIPLTILDTTYITISDTVYTDADTVYSDSTTIIYKYGTYVSAFNTPLAHGSATVNTRHGEWLWEIKYRNLKLNLEFPDKYDFRKVIVTTVPDLGSISVSLNSDYKPLKKLKGFEIAAGFGYDHTQEVFLMGDISWRKNRIGLTLGKGGRGYYYTRTLLSF